MKITSNQYPYLTSHTIDGLNAAYAANAVLSSIEDARFYGDDASVSALFTEWRALCHKAQSLGCGYMLDN